MSIYRKFKGTVVESAVAAMESKTLGGFAPNSSIALAVKILHDEILKDVALSNDVGVGSAEVSLLLALAVLSTSLQGMLEVVSLLLEDKQRHLLPSAAPFLAYFRR